MTTPSQDNLSETERAQKVQSLREMIASAEKTIQSAKAMLLQFEGKKRVGRKRKFDEDSEEKMVQGTFDGQIMVGSDGKHYPVPANYASKSKLVEGDLLKLTITDDGSFIYKQIGPIERKHALGIVAQDEAGNYYVIADGRPFKILLASITYFRVEPGDEVAIVHPRTIESHWASIESVVQKAKFSTSSDKVKVSEDQIALAQACVYEQEQMNETSEDAAETFPEETDNTTNDGEFDSGSDNEDEINADEESETNKNTNSMSLLEEWQADIEEIEREIEAATRSKEQKKTEEDKVLTGV